MEPRGKRPQGPISKLDPKFKYEIAEQPGAESIKRCFQCASCSATCPIMEIDSRFNPRKIVQMVLLGMRERVLSSDFIWLCTSCYACVKSCPQEVKIPDVIYAIRNMAAKEGYIHPAFAKPFWTSGLKEG